MNKLQVFPVSIRHNEEKNKWGKFPLTNGESWQSYKSSVDEIDRAKNIGIVIPTGVIVIDIDTYKGVTTGDIDKALGCKLDWSAAELQKTVSGGYHYGFLIGDAILKQGSDILGVVGFDTRTSGKGWICSGNGYECLAMDDVVEVLGDANGWLPALPDNVIELLSETKKGFLNDGSNIDDLDLMLAAQPLDDLSIDQMREYLFVLDSHHYENESDWFRVGMAIYHQMQGSDKGYDLFDEFSKQGSNYDENKNRKRWDSFDSSSRVNPITFASVIKAAGGKKVVVSQNEYQTYKEQINKAENTTQLHKCVMNLGLNRVNDLNVDMLLNDVKKKFIILDGATPSLPVLRKIVKANKPNEKSGNFVDDFVFVQSYCEYMSRDTKECMNARAFDTTYNRLTPINDDGEKQNATVYSNDIIECVAKAMYAPMFANTFTHDTVNYINLYRPTLLNRVNYGTTNIVERVKKHIAHLVASEEEQDIIINYLAHNVQFPGIKIHWAIVLQGVQGDGKSFLAEMMQHVLGMYNVRMMNAQTLGTNFSGWAAGQCMTFIEELKIDNKQKYEILNNMKPYITNTTVESTPKGKDPQVVMNTTNYFALTNFKDAIPLDDTDRRYCIIFSRWQNASKLAVFQNANPRYYQDLYEDMRANAGEILDWLMSYKIPEKFMNTNRAPETTAKELMKDLSKSEGFIMIDDAIEEFNCEDINKDIVNITKLSKLVEIEWSNADIAKFPKTSGLKNILVGMGFHYIGRKHNEERKLQSIYALDENLKIADIDTVPF